MLVESCVVLAAKENSAISTRTSCSSGCWPPVRPGWEVVTGSHLRPTTVHVRHGSHTHVGAQLASTPLHLRNGGRPALRLGGSMGIRGRRSIPSPRAPAGRRPVLHAVARPRQRFFFPAVGAARLVAVDPAVCYPCAFALLFGRVTVWYLARQPMVMNQIRAGHGIINFQSDGTDKPGIVRYTEVRESYETEGHRETVEMPMCLEHRRKKVLP